MIRLFYNWFDVIGFNFYAFRLIELQKIAHFFADYLERWNDLVCGIDEDGRVRDGIQETSYFLFSLGVQHFVDLIVSWLKRTVMAAPMGPPPPPPPPVPANRWNPWNSGKRNQLVCWPTFFSRSSGLKGRNSALESHRWDLVSLTGQNEFPVWTNFFFLSMKCDQRYTLEGRGTRTSSLHRRFDCVAVFARIDVSFQLIELVAGNKVDEMEP